MFALSCVFVKRFWYSWVRPWLATKAPVQFANSHSSNPRSSRSSPPKVQFHKRPTDSTTRSQERRKRAKMPLSTITATLDSTLRCTFTELCSQQSANLTQDASISFTTLLTAGSTLLATVYAAASSSLTLSSIKLCSFYSKQRLLDGHPLIETNEFSTGLNSTLEDDLFDSLADNRTVANTSPTQSEIVSITGALIVFTVLLATVLLTHLFDTIDTFTRKCCKINVSNLLQVGAGVRYLTATLNQLLLDLLITVVLKSSLLTSLFVDEKSLKLNKKLRDYDGVYNADRSHDEEDDESRQLVDELIESLDEDGQLFLRQRKWSTWFAGQLRKRLVH